MNNALQSERKALLGLARETQRQINSLEDEFAGVPLSTGRYVRSELRTKIDGLRKSLGELETKIEALHVG